MNREMGLTDYADSPQSNIYSMLFIREFIICTEVPQRADILLVGTSAASLG